MLVAEYVFFKKYVRFYCVHLSLSFLSGLLVGMNAIYLMAYLSNFVTWLASVCYSRI